MSAMSDYMLDVPMYFVRRNGEYIDAAGQSFRDFMKGELFTPPAQRLGHRQQEDPEGRGQSETEKRHHAAAEHGRSQGKRVRH